MLLLLLSVFLVPTLAILPVPGGLLATFFSQLDLDGSGDLTKVELWQFIQQFDVDYDGVVLEAEIRANIPIGIPDNLELLYTFYDIDSITGITQADVNLLVKRFDINQDGKITLAEQVVNTKLGVYGV